MFDSKEYRTKMTAVVTHFDEEMKKVRTGRAHPDMLSGIMVESYGQMMPLPHLANITVADATMLQVTPFDPNNLQNINAAIRTDQTLGLNPSDDGHVIRVPVPPLTEERRRQLSKQCKGESETAKVSVRNARRDAIDALKKAVKDGMAEDEQKNAEAKLQKIHDKFIKQIDDMLAAKDKEIMTV